MIPRRLRIRNFLSYRDCEVDLTGLQLAVLCGPNGNGKSALLDAMTWALWGEARGRLEDDRIHLGEHDMLVDFEFESSGDLFQVIRKRTRGKAAGTLDFLQLKPEGGRIPLTGGTVSETQAEIVRKLRMDYDTFVNSAFIAQGRANEFTKKRPAERKEVFRNVLGLGRYQEIAEAAGERRKDAVAALRELERNMGEATDEVQHLPAIRADLAALAAERDTIEPDLHRLEGEVVELRQAATDHARLEREAIDALRAVESLRETTVRLETTVAQLERDLAAAQEQLAQAPDIRRAHALLEQLREEEQAMATLQQQGLALQGTITDADRRISVERARIETDLAGNRKGLETAETAAASLGDLLDQQQALAGQQGEIQRLVDESESLEAKAAELRTRAAREGEKANEAARQNTLLKEREAQLDTAEAACPVCLKPLVAGDMDHVRLEYARQRDELRERYETCRASKASALDEADRVTAAATTRRDDARRRETASRER
ncbi:MAG: AAA family ATPase, partial [Tepidiformaceae bacterium]